MALQFCDGFDDYNVKRFVEDHFPQLAQRTQGIINQPDDDDLRRLFADEWDAIGFLDSDRSELIRLQLQGQWSEAWSILYRKPAVVFAPRFAKNHPIFHRGFVEHITISSQEPADTLRLFFSIAPVQHLDITDARDLPGLLNRLVDFGKHIRSLSLYGGSDAWIEQLVDLQDHFPKLHYLAAQHGTITTTGVQKLAASSLPLRRVNLRDNPAQELFDQTYYDGDVLCHVTVPIEQDALPARPWLKAESEKIPRY